jgi:glucokinase
MTPGAISIGIDIGGTTTRAGLVDADDRITALISRPTVRGAAAIVEGTVDLVDALLKQSEHQLTDIGLVGVGMPGLVDSNAGEARHSANLGLGESPVPMRDLLAHRLGRPVWLSNDVNAAALGAARELDGSDAHFARTGAIAYLSIGTGIAAGWVLDGKVWSGASGAAGEIGHISIDPNGPACECGQRGCIEAIASGSAITRKWPTESGSSIAALTTATTSGRPDAVAIWDGVIDGLARAVNIVTMRIDPDLIVLGGGMANHGDVVIPLIASSLRNRLSHSALLTSLDMADRLRHVRDVDQVGVVGAVLAASETGP